MKQDESGPDQGHPIQVAARRSGLTPDVIRAWERRYNAVDPVRSGTNRRLYAETDIEKLFLLSQVTRAGRRIGDVAGLTIDQLKEIVAEDGEAAARVGGLPASPARGRTEGQYLEACMDYLVDLDSVGLESTLAEASIALSTPVLLEQLITPLLHRVGEEWHSGSLRVAHEHLTTAVVRSLLGTLRKSGSAPATAPELVVASPAGQRHELGALMVAVAAASDGWKVTYLGADLPAADIATVALKRNARAVALSIVHPTDDPNLPGEIEVLGSALGGEAVILAGGSGAGAYAGVLAAAGGRIIEDIPSFRNELQALRMP
ncbi:MAG: MerR family transcriptional regulator [Acidobacteria bacterium]|uniref:MerR family transcriptional regulator n=1 Tax=Candidatus Polarisedimenticola svalbardensis TaxID=2886004 RepID=A0A8J6Y6N5_9BACT|nr:MerR family transcriptional regulator [Candidatus Polarisedimenticola svalbardensis]